MTLELSGSNREDRGPAGCVARFLIAADARDSDACREELHEQSRAQVEGAPEAPPMRSAAIGSPIAVGDRFEVAVDFVGEGGAAQRFVFVVRAANTATGLGIDLDATMHATFGGDPAQLLADAMKEAFAPIGAAMEKLGEGIGAALSGMTIASTDDAARRPQRGDARPPTAATIDMPVLELEVVQLDFMRSLGRPWGSEPAEQSTALRLCCRFDVPVDIVLDSCAGVTVDVAQCVDGEDLRPADGRDDLGATDYSPWDRQDRNWRIDLQLGAPSPSFRGLARFEGRVRLQLAATPDESVAGRLAELIGRSLPVPALDAQLSFARDENGAFTVRTRHGVLDHVELSFVDSSGQGMSSGFSGWGDGETGTRCYDADLPDDATVVLRISPTGDVVEAPFTTRGLPLVFD